MRSASATKSAQRATSSLQVVARGAHRFGRRRRRDADAEREDAGRRVPVAADHAPAHGVAGSSRRAPRPARDDHPAPGPSSRRPESTRPVGREHLDRVPGDDGHRLVEPEPDLRAEATSSRDCVAGCELSRMTCAERRVRSDSSTSERQPPGASDASHGPTRPEATEDRRRVPVGEEQHGEQRRRSARSPRATRPTRGRSACAEREERRGDEHPADRVVEERRPRVEPVVRLVHEERGAARRASAAAGTSDHARARELSADDAPAERPPQTIAACAHTACASRCIVEKVEKIVITQSRTLDAMTTAGKR